MIPARGLSGQLTLVKHCAYHRMVGGVKESETHPNAVGLVGHVSIHAPHTASKPVFRALEDSPTLKGLYRFRDPRFVIRAKDLASHQGYQSWHRRLDEAVVRWIWEHGEATAAQFETYLRNRYLEPDLLSRFPGGL